MPYTGAMAARPPRRHRRDPRPSRRGGRAPAHRAPGLRRPGDDALRRLRPPPPRGHHRGRGRGDRAPPGSPSTRRGSPTARGPVYPGRMRHRLLLLGSLSLLLAVTGYACGSGAGGRGTAAPAGRAPAASPARPAGSGGGDGGLFTDHGKVLGLVVTPPSSTLDVTNGAASPRPVHGHGHLRGQDHRRRRPDLVVRPSRSRAHRRHGKLAPSGTTAGHGTVTATFMGLGASAGVDVILHVTQNPAQLDPTQQGAFSTPDASASGTLLYPYDQTVFARGLLAPELQWVGGAAGAAYLVHFTEKFFEGTFYVSADPPSRFAIPPTPGPSSPPATPASPCRSTSSGSRAGWPTRPCTRPGPSPRGACADPSTTGRSTPGSS